MPESTNQQPVNLSAERQERKSFWDSMSGELRGIIITSIVGLTTLLITTAASIWTKKFEYEAQEVQMKREFEYELLMKVFGVGDKKEAAKQLEFFIETGFLEDKNGKIMEMAKDPSTIPNFSPGGLRIRTKNGKGEWKQIEIDSLDETKSLYEIWKDHKKNN